MYKVRVKVPKEYKSMLDNMLDKLEKNNVAYSGNKGLIMSFSMQSSQPKSKGHLFFSYNKQWRKSVVSLAPNVKLKRNKCGFDIIEINGQ